MTNFSQMKSLTLTDLPKIQRIAEQNPFAWTDTMLRECFVAGDNIYGIEANQQLVAYGIMRSVLDEAEILMIAVDQTLRRQGCGKLLLASMLSTVQKIGIQAVHLEVRVSNHAAIKLYEKLGFQQTGIRKNYYQTETGREDAMILVWRFA